MLEDLQVNDYQFDSLTQMNDNLQYLDYINHNYQFQDTTVDPHLSYKYQGNLFGLFREMGIQPHLFVYTMYLNNYSDPREFDGIKTTFKLAIKPPIPAQ